MASFPSAVKAFTTKFDGAGNPINAAHVNDLQDEVNAIEDGYVNGTARLNSSNSTTARLNVTGVSTLGGALTLGAGIASTVSFASSVTFSSGVTFSTSVVFATKPVIAPEIAVVFLETFADVGSSVSSTLAFRGEHFVSNSSMHSTSVNPERLIPQTTGLYQITAGIQTVSAPTALSNVFIDVLDSSGAVVGIQGHHVSTASFQLQATAYKRFDALGGYITVGFGNSAGGSTHSFSTAFGRTWVALVKM